MFRHPQQAAQLIRDLKRALVAARAVHAADTDREYSEEMDTDGLLDRAEEGAAWLESYDVGDYDANDAPHSPALTVERLRSAVQRADDKAITSGARQRPFMALHAVLRELE